MEFPITRERLQNYRVNEAEIKKRVALELKCICEAVETIVLTTNHHKYVYRISNATKYGNIKPGNSTVSLVNQKSILNELIESIKNTFPDSNIILDPLETYILIDWS